MSSEWIAENITRIEGDKVKKVAIITFHNAVNYGAILQCYALQSFLDKRFGYSVDILDYHPLYFRKVFFDPLKPWQAYGLKNKGKALAKCILRTGEMRDLSKKRRELLRFMRERLHLCPMEIGQSNSYEYYTTGSDQIWNLELLENDTTYLLDFVQHGRKISYAASFKISDVDDFARNAYQKYLPNFDSISVRESDLQTYLRDNYQIEADCVLDPTLLIGGEFWKKEVHEVPLISEKYLLLYYVNMPKQLVRQAFIFAEKRGLKVVSLNAMRDRTDYLDYSRASIEEFLNLLANAETVFTTSFHGMAFSILFEREFYYEVPDNSYNNNARLEDLAWKLGLLDRNIMSDIKSKKIDWDKIRCKLVKYQKISTDFLTSALAANENL